MNMSANQGIYSSQCFNNGSVVPPSRCPLPNPATIATCQAWGLANGFNTVGLQARADAN